MNKMAATSAALTAKVESGSPYKLDTSQTLKASRALLKYMKKSKAEKAQTASKRNLLDDEGGSEDDGADETPIWLTLTTKKHIIDKERLKPSKLSVPHPLNLSTTATICLITADPQRTYKDIVASAAFPAEIRQRITRVIGLSKIKAKYNQYEAQRQLKADHDLFLADERIITQLPKLLGANFYKSTTKRPIPVFMQPQPARTEGKRIKRAKGEEKSKDVIEPQKLGAEITKALAATLVALSPSTNTAVRVGYAGWSAEKVAENIEAVVNGLIEKHVPKKWRGVRSVHIKGPETAAMPIWLADELWEDEKDVHEDEKTEEQKSIEANVGKKRKAINEGSAKKRKAADAPLSEETEGKKIKLLESNDDTLDKEIALRKEKLKKLKEEAAKSGGDEVPVVAKREKRARKVKSSEVAA